MKLTTEHYCIILGLAAILCLAIIVPFYAQVWKSTGNTIRLMDGHVATAGDDRMKGRGKGLPVKYRITIGTSVRAYDDGKEITLAELQKRVEVGADGKLGPVTVQKVLDLNRTDINYVQELMK